MTDLKLRRYMTEVVCRLTEAQNQISDALRRIGVYLGDSARTQEVQLLALRRYVRLGGHQVARAWPWTAKELDDHAEQTAALKAAADATARNFSLQNPDLTLDRSPFRDLPRQVQLWCDNPTVHQAAPRLYSQMLKVLDRPEFPDLPTESDLGWIAVFRAELGQAVVRPEPTSAAPGTSDHGQDRAVDFVVQKKGITIAGTSKAKMQEEWVDTGYVDALKDAAVGTHLVGPLMKNKVLWEAWHYRLETPAKKKNE